MHQSGFGLRRVIIFALFRSISAGPRRRSGPFLEKLACAIGSDLVVGLAPDIADKRIKSLVASGRAVIREGS